MFDIEKEREAFEAIPEINDKLHTVYFDETFNNYFAAMVNSGPTVKYVQGAWMAWQEQAKKLEGCVVVPVELSESIAEKMALDKVEKPRKENDAVWQEIADQAYKDSLLQKKWEIIRNYKELVEAARGGK
ncbi:hypothetical protein [Acinetobacter sp. A47]|uniref:hypothetical protein n=1 Tax=Acinetobacter sp. A47 TaxID=1561217 RepID=UPI0006895B8F|nr:hypothetical protein [Acinetobacter sp. A47]